MTRRGRREGAAAAAGKCILAGGLGYPSIPVAVLRERETSPLNKFITRVREMTCRFSEDLLLQGLLTPKAF